MEDKEISVLSNIDDKKDLGEFFSSRKTAWGWSIFYKRHFDGKKPLIEFYVAWDDFKDVILGILQDLETRITRKPKVLVPGPGDSLLSVHLYKNGFQDILNVDYCDDLKDWMPDYDVDIKWRVDNFLDAKVDPKGIDAIIDKGCLDYVAFNLPSGETAETICSKYFDQVKKMLDSHGVFVWFTKLIAPGIFTALCRRFWLGWKVNIQRIFDQADGKSVLMIVVEKNTTSFVGYIQRTDECTEELTKCITVENDLRKKFNALLSKNKDVEIGAYRVIRLSHEGRKSAGCGVIWVPEDFLVFNSNCLTDISKRSYLQSLFEKIQTVSEILVVMSPKFDKFFDEAHIDACVDELATHLKVNVDLDNVQKWDNDLDKFVLTKGQWLPPTSSGSIGHKKEKSRSSKKKGKKGIKSSTSKDSAEINTDPQEIVKEESKVHTGEDDGTKRTDSTVKEESKSCADKDENLHETHMDAQQEMRIDRGKKKVEDEVRIDEGISQEVSNEGKELIVWKETGAEVKEVKKVTSIITLEKIAGFPFFYDDDEISMKNHPFTLLSWMETEHVWLGNAKGSNEFILPLKREALLIIQGIISGTLDYHAKYGPHGSISAHNIMLHQEVQRCKGSNRVRYRVEMDVGNQGSFDPTSSLQNDMQDLIKIISELLENKKVNSEFDHLLLLLSEYPYHEELFWKDLLLKDYPGLWDRDERAHFFIELYHQTISSGSKRLSFKSVYEMAVTKFGLESILDSWNSEIPYDSPLGEVLRGEGEQYVKKFSEAEMSEVVRFIRHVLHHFQQKPSGRNLQIQDVEVALSNIFKNFIVAIYAGMCMFGAYLS